MLVNKSHIDARKEQEINQKVGASYGFFKALRLGGVGSQRLSVEEASGDFKELFDLDRLPDHCNIEIRPFGLIIHFRSRLEAFAWILPWSGVQLSVIGQQWRIAAGNQFMIVSGANNKALDARFLGRLLKLQSNQVKV